MVIPTETLKYFRQILGCKVINMDGITKFCSVYGFLRRIILHFFVVVVLFGWLWFCLLVDCFLFVCFVFALFCIGLLNCFPVLFF